MKKLRSLLCILLVLVMTAALFACGGGAKPGDAAAGSSDAAGASASGGAPASGGSANPGSTDSGAAVAKPNLDDYVSRTIYLSYMGQFVGGLSPNELYPGTNAVFDQVFIPDAATKAVTSRILKEWYTEDNGYNWILKMRDDIYFSNGDNAKSNDLLYSYTSFADRNSSSLSAYGFDWDNCKTLDDYTVQMAFEAPYSGFQVATQINLYNEKWCREVGFDSLEWQYPVGSGPYYCDKWEQDVQVVLKLRDDYWYKDEGPYYVDEWILKPYADLTTMWMAFETGALDMGPPSSADYSRFVKEGGEGYDVVKKSAGTTHNFYFGMIDRKPLWDDIRMREAISYAVPWAELGMIFYADRYIPSDSIATSENPYHINPGSYEYNVDKAKEILAEFGYNSSNPLTLDTTQMETDRPMLEALQYYLDQVGVKLTINFVDTATASSVYRSREGNDVATWFAHRGSAFHELRASVPYAGAFHESFEYIDDEDFQDIYHKMQAASSEADLEKYCKELQQIVYDKILIIPISELPLVMGYHTDKFTEEQIQKYVITSAIIQTQKLGLLSSWE